MVFQKKANKGGKPNPKTPQRKSMKMEEAADMFEDSDDMDSNDSEDAPKTPATKTPKGKQQPASERKVSFQFPGKNTPAKTPSKDTPAKMQSKNSPFKATPAKAKGTPVKAGLQQFSGMKKKQKQDNKEEEDEDDDDEDDSDFEGDDLGDDLDLAFDDDDDDDDEDDDEEDDDDDDDDDNEEEEKVVEKLVKNKKQEKQTPTKTKGEKQPKEKSPKSAKKETPKKDVSSVMKVSDKDRLYLGNLPKDATMDEIKKLSPDILTVYLPIRSKTNKSNKAYAFLQFASEEKAEENYKTLQTAKFRYQPVNVDYVGEKSIHKPALAAKDGRTVNTRKLFVSGLPMDVSLHQVAKFFPKAYQVTFNSSQEYRMAFINFWTADDCKEALASHPSLEINGEKLPVLHAVEGGKKQKKKNKKRKQNGLQHSAKKMKLTPAADSDDDEDEE